MSCPEKFGPDESADDIVCGLPKNLIDIILERVPIRDAVRTSILSRKWRYLWSGRTTLVFDGQFFEVNFKNKSNPAYVYMNLIHNILLLRTEPVNEFTLHIPKLSFDWNVYLDKCLLFLTRNGINKLELYNMSASPFQLPSCVFSCPTLKVMSIQNCLFKPRKSVSEFANLNFISFRDMTLAPDTFGDFVPVLPCLTHLTFQACSGIENFNIFAPKLRYFAAVISDDVKALSFDKFPKLLSLFLGVRDTIYEQGRDTSFNSNNFLKNVPLVRLLCINGCFLKFTAVTTLYKRFSFTFRYLNQLKLYLVQFDDLDQISCALCLLRSSPSLKKLEIKAPLPCKDTTIESESVSSHLEAPNYMDEMLKLKEVKFVSMSCSKPELLFVKGILARSPTLKTMHFECINKNCDGFKISNEVLGYRRASSQAEVIFSCETLASTRN